jgi:spermidine/putrescine transport system substrate-binding protein
MTLHPREPRGYTRREALLRAGGAAISLSSIPGFLAACGNSGAGTTGTSAAGGWPVGPGGIPLARASHPVTLKRWEDPIASGMKPETGGTFTIFNYPEYLDPAVLKAFGRKYGVTVKVTPFDNIATGVTKLASGTVSPDVTEMTPDQLPRVVAGKLVKPLNLDYIPNLKNVWSGFQSPYYDVGSRYGVPYTVYSTGIAYRTDRVKEDIPNLKPNPWDIFWHSQKYTGKVALLSEERETIAMALLHRGIKDINTEDPKLVNRAVKDLQELSKICSIKVGDLQYQTVPEDKAWLNQAWSGDMLAGYFYYLPDKETGKLLRFWNPGYGNGPIGNDMWCICSTTKKPVLAHLFLNYMLDNGVAYKNFVDFNGYQPPLNEIQSESLIKKGVIPETLGSSVLSEHDFGPKSLVEAGLTNAGESLWQNGYATFTSGA